jgi:hypothetical protein
MLSVVDEESIKSIKQPDGIFLNTYYATLYPDLSFSTKLYADIAEDNLVADVSLEENLNLTLADAVEELEIPESIIITRYRGDLFVMLIDPAKGTAFGYSSVGRTAKYRNTIQADHEINTLIFFDPLLYDLISTTGMFSFYLSGAELADEDVYRWGGYGKLDEKYPP